MQTSIVMTLLGTDRPGLVRVLADLVANHGGNWLDSRMARLAGQFAGIVRIECPEETVESLIEALKYPQLSDLTVLAVREKIKANPARHTVSVDVMGNDRAGIVRELTSAIANAGGNIEEFTSGLESAPMSGHPMFRAHGIISISDTTEVASLVAAIESLGGDLTVDVSI